VWNVLRRSSTGARLATFRSHFLSPSWSMAKIQIIVDAVCHWIPWPLSCAHQHSSAPRSVQRSPVLRHTCPHQTPHTVLHLFSPFVIYSSDDVITPFLPTRRVTLHSPLLLTFRPSLLQHKFLVLQNLLGPWVPRAIPLPVYSYLCIRHCGTEITHTAYLHVLQYPAAGCNTG